MRWRRAGLADLEVLVDLNRQLQEDEGADVMAPDALAARMRRWLGAQYSAVVFEADGALVAYVLYRDADPDVEGADAVFVQQFFVVRDRRRGGIGRRAFDLFVREVVPAGRPILLEALASNPAGRRFWESVGFGAYATRYVRGGGDP